MSTIRVVKSYTEMVSHSPQELAYLDDRAVADFRGFHQVAALHVERISSSLAANILLDILSALEKDLRERKNRLE